MIKRTLIYTLASLAVMGSAQTMLYAQEYNIQTLEQKQIESVENPWNALPNAAALGFSTHSEGSQVAVGFNHEDGDYHLAGEAGRQNGLNFDASMYQSIGELLRFSGHFALNYTHQNDRAYNDMLFPTENAYLFGAKRKGTYNIYTYDLNFKVATVDLNGWNFGFGLDYKAGDLSRILDPRPRVLSAEYQLTPSATYKFNDKHRLGVSAYYKFEKQRLDNIIQTNKDLDYDYFFTTGLDNAYSTVSYGTFFRSYEDNIVGLDMQYGLSASQWNWVTSVGAAFHNLAMVGEEKRKPGTYDCTDIHVQTAVTLKRSNQLHSFGVQATYLDGANTAYVQDYEQVFDEHGNSSEEWITQYKFVTYKHKNIDVSAKYDLYLGDVNQKDYSMQMGLSGAYKKFKREYILPYSEHEMSAANVDAYFGTRLYNKNNRKLWLTVGSGLVLPIDQTMSLFNDNEYSDLVLRADEAHYNRFAYNYNAELTYSFPLVVGKTALNAYVKAEYKQLVSEDSAFDRTRAALTFGILTF